MEKRLLQYFKEEKQATLFFLILGIISLLVGLLGCFYFKGPLWTGIGIPLAAIALIQLIVSLTVYFRTGPQVQRLLAQLEQHPLQFIDEELPRMKKVNASFQLYRNIGLALFLLGFTFVIMGGIANWGPFVLGTGIGLTLQSTTMMIFDLFAELRASIYTSAIIQFKNDY